MVISLDAPIPGKSPSMTASASEFKTPQLFAPFTIKPSRKASEHGLHFREATSHNDDLCPNGKVEALFCGRSES